MFRPTLTIRGLQAGFVGAEANTIIPHRATVALDLRLVKNQRVEAVYRRVVEHIRAQGFTVIESADAPLAGRPAGPRGPGRRAARLRSCEDRRPTCRSRGAWSRSSSAPTTASRRWWCPPRAAACRSGRSPISCGSRRSSCPYANANNRAAQPQRAPPAGPPLPGRPHGSPTPSGRWGTRASGARVDAEGAPARSRSVAVGGARRPEDHRASWWSARRACRLSAQSRTRVTERGSLVAGPRARREPGIDWLTWFRSNTDTRTWAPRSRLPGPRGAAVDRGAAGDGPVDLEPAGGPARTG
mgnify:CR=1 FL=1